MKRQQTILAILFLSLLHSVQAQYSGLDSINGTSLKVYYSRGNQPRAEQLARLTDSAISYGSKLLNFHPDVTLLILSPSDWPGYTGFPVYGMPHYSDKRTLVVAAEDNDFWRSFIPPVDQLPQELAQKIKQVYNNGNALSMQPFFDLLAIHELGHAFQSQAGLQPQRLWMGELFCNIFLHSFIADKEAHLLPALTVFPNMVVAGGTDGLVFTSLEDFENNYNELGKQHPGNYGWYQCRLHRAAAEIYDQGGAEVLVKLWKALRTNEKMNDGQFADYLSEEVHAAVADVLRKW